MVENLPSQIMYFWTIGKILYHSLFSHLFGMLWIQYGLWCSTTKKWLHKYAGSLLCFHHLSPFTGKPQDVAIECSMTWIITSPTWFWNPSKFLENKIEISSLCPWKAHQNLNHSSWTNFCMISRKDFNNLIPSSSNRRTRPPFMGGILLTTISITPVSIRVSPQSSFKRCLHITYNT